jgi:hypothetical protein
MAIKGTFSTDRSEPEPLPTPKTRNFIPPFDKEKEIEEILKPKKKS